jgi:hypothetical protein
MSTALENFEQLLVTASRTLAGKGAALGDAPAPSPRRRLRTRAPLPRLRQLGLALQLAILITSFSAVAGAVAAVYYWVAGGPASTQSLASFSCLIGPRSGTGDAITVAITGDPVIDCRLAWIHSEGRPAPPLAAWRNGLGVQTAVVLPASAGPPRESTLGGWHRLPPGWTVDLPVVELNDQLNDISARMDDGPVCTYATRAVAIARSLLLYDDLHGWHVALTVNNGPLSRDCRHIAANVDEATKTIQLIQIQQLSGREGHSAPGQARIERDYRDALSRLLTLQAVINRRLTTGCDSIGEAAALWTREARSAGFKPATAAFWRRVQNLSAATKSGPPPLPHDFFRTYTLVLQPASQRTGSCARILIQDNGDTNYVYAARMAP